MIRRRNERFDKNTCVIIAGEHFATDEDILIETVLGSCIAVCLRDPFNGVAGMNHFLLPDGNNPPQVKGDQSGRYGTHAMELLINAMMRTGADRRTLEAKVFGGGNVTNNTRIPVGEWNADFALNFLNVEGIPVVAKDVGGNSGRRIVFFTRQGNIKLRRLGNDEATATVVREKRYQADIARVSPRTKTEPDLTLF